MKENLKKYAPFAGGTTIAITGKVDAGATMSHSRNTFLI